MTLRKRFIPLALAALLAAPSLSFAADAAKVDEFMEVMQFEENFAQMKQMMAQMMDQGFEQGVQQNGLEGKALEQARASHEVMKRTMIEEMMSWDSMRAEISQIYQQQLTDAEIDAAVAYYRSPEGASMLAKQPALMQATMAVGQRRAEALVPKMQAELKAIFEQHGETPRPEG